MMTVYVSFDPSPFSKGRGRTHPRWRRLLVGNGDPPMHSSFRELGYERTLE